MFSVIVPVYNVDKYLNKCIESILEQTYTDFELVLIDDGSTDNCANICDDYAKKDHRVRVIHKENGGVVKARQAGVESALGDYLIFIDGDDYISQNCFETIANVADADIIRFGYYFDNGNIFAKYPLKERKGFYSKDDIEREIFPELIQSVDAKYFSPSVWGGAFRRELFVNNMLKDTKLAIGEDGACVIPCVFNAQSMVVLEDCLYYYRHNDSSATKGKNVFKWDGPEIIARHLKSKIDLSKYDLQEQLYRKIVHELFSVVVSQFNRKEKYRKIKQDIKVNLENPLYKEAIEKARFKYSKKASLMHFALKKKLFFVIKTYNKIIY